MSVVRMRFEISEEQKKALAIHLGQRSATLDQVREEITGTVTDRFAELTDEVSDEGGVSCSLLLAFPMAGGSCDSCE